MVIGKVDNSNKWRTNGTIESFECLGVKVQSNARMDEEINERINSIIRLYHLLNRAIARR